AAPRGGPVPLVLSPTRPAVPCPRCGSADTEETSRFAATSCKALWRCRACREPFEYVKEI
ncbi:phenylacetate-CoA oxygenase subunit PaaJ, partial [Streptomyces sp. ICN988]|nr:phenylacetate-CoA oxygenase subunit PaaJ [Streptomyces sp. ICN988]